MTYSRIIKTALPTFARAPTYSKRSGFISRSTHISSKSTEIAGYPPKPPQNDQIKCEDLASSRFFALHRPLLSVNGNDAFLNTEAIFPKPLPRTPTADTIFDNNFESELPEELETSSSTIPEYVRMGPFAGTVIPPPNLFLLELPQDKDVLKTFFEDIKSRYAESTPEVSQLDRTHNLSESNIEVDETEYKPMAKKSHPLGK